MDVDYLRTALREDAQLVGTPDPTLYRQVIARRQRSNRRRLAGIAAALVALLVGIGVPVALNSLEARDDSEVANPSGIDGPLGLPTRGDLADDADFVEQVRQQPWANPDLEPALETRHVVFASDIAGRRIALVVGTRVDGELGASWFLFQNGAYQGPTTYDGAVSANEPLAAGFANGAASVLVVIAAPGDIVEFSSHTQIDNAGTISRTYEPVGTVEGVAITGLEGSPDCAVCGVSVKVSRNGQLLFRGAPVILGGPTSTPDPGAIEFDDTRGLAERVPDPSWIASGFAALAAPVGLPINELSPQLLFAGPIPGPSTWETTVIVVAITLPSGATAVHSGVFVSHLTPGSTQAGEILSVGGEIYVLPAVLMEISGVALRLQAPTDRGDGAPVSLLILAPTQYSTARPLGPGDVVVGTDIPLDEGLAVVPYVDPTVRLTLHGPGADSTTVEVGEGERSSRYADAGPGYVG